MSIQTGLKKTALILALGTMSAGVVHAAPMITEWEYTVTTEWVTIGAHKPGFTSGTDNNVVEQYMLSWGANKGFANNRDPDTWKTNNSATARSGLVITPDSGITRSDLVTGGGTVNTHTITHYNNEISDSFQSLEDATVKTTLTLTPIAPPPYDGSTSLGTRTSTYTVHFTETSNKANVEDCPDKGSTSNCDDIFVLDAGDLVDSFDFGGYTYTLTIGAPGLGPLGKTACELAKAGNDDCVGFRTEEFTSTPITFNFKIEAVPSDIPEPGVLGLLGLGLAAAGMRLRRRRS